MAIIYIAGPMTGLKDFNRDSFYLAERALKAQGHEVRNPACLGTDWSKYQDYIEVGLVMLRQCEAICFLPGSEHSKGATIEDEEAAKHCLENVTHLLRDVKGELNAQYLIAKGGGEMTYPEWAARHPQAAAELHQLLNAEAHFQPEGAPINSEAYAQQQARLQIAKQGGMAWRNNVGASKAKEQHSCPRCQFRFEVEQAPVRWGLANDSAKLNAKIKSSDLIGIVPRLITPGMVGTTIGQFLAVETKKPGWKFSGNEHETAQLQWLELIAGKGGLSMFSTGAVQL